MKPKPTYKILNRILDAIHPRSIATVLITSLIGPLAVVLTNRHIQNKNIQKELISTVMQTASSSDYSKAEAMEKIGIIAGIVQENKHLFGLSFEQTMNTVADLKQRSTAVLYEEMALVKNEIQSLEQKTTLDSNCIIKLETERDKLSSEIEALEMEKVKLSLISQSKLDSLKQVKNQHEIKIKSLEGERRVDIEKLGLLNMRINTMESDLKHAKEKMQLLLSENQEHKTTLNQTKKLLQQAEVDKQQLKGALLDIQNSLEKQMEQNKILQQEMVKLREANLELGRMVVGK